MNGSSRRGRESPPCPTGRRERGGALPAPRALAWNGVDGSTGRYLLPGLTRRELARRIREGETTPRLGPPGETGGQGLSTPTGPSLPVTTRAPVPWIDPGDLASSGWGVVFSSAERADVHEALGPLLAHRRTQTGQPGPGRYEEYGGERGLVPGESATDWLTRHGTGPASPADPRHVPYYLLLVGDPQTIPFEVQFELSAGYAVGRLAFETSEEYANYAAGVLSSEGSGDRGERRAVLFGVDNPDDPATDFMRRYLMQPVRERLRSLVPDWDIRCVDGLEATKATLGRLFAGGRETPALLFTTSHGMGFEADDPRLERHTGALLCRDWPGPDRWRQAIPRDYYFAADDIAEEADLSGLISVNFACYSAGIPRHDSFLFAPGRDGEIAPRDLIAPLPQRLLGKEGGNASAVLGHVDRARGFSFLWPGAGSQPQTLLAVLRDLLCGERAGRAARHFGTRYSGLAVAFQEAKRRLTRGEEVSEVELTDLWVAFADARGYVLLGDPAVRLAVAASARPRLRGAAHAPPVEER